MCLVTMQCILYTIHYTAYTMIAATIKTVASEIENNCNLHNISHLYNF